MGLDMYAYKTKENIPPANFTDPEDATEIFYWRKHPNLHGWMHNLYDGKGGEQPDFNCDPVRLDAEDIDALEKDLDNLPHGSGPFFGESRPEDKLDDIRFIETARQALREGYTIFYTSWW
jgi:hypothetical protein